MLPPESRAKALDDNCRWEQLKIWLRIGISYKQFAAELCGADRAGRLESMDNPTSGERVKRGEGWLKGWSEGRWFLGGGRG